MLKRLLLFLSVSLLWVSCTLVSIVPQDPEQTPEIDVEEENVRYEIISDETFQYDVFITQLIGESSLTAGLPDFYKLLVTGQINSYLTKLKTHVGVHDGLAFRRIVYQYESTDQHGKPITLSAIALWLGYNDGEVWVDVAPDDICLMEHFTITSDDECPSRGWPFEAFVNGNSLVIMPDYIGYGATSGLVHPYMNHNLCALNSIDALTAGYVMFEELSASGLKSGWTTSVAGASQGGGNALAVHKMIDSDSSLSERWRFSHSYCAAGPYNPELTVEMYLEAGKTDHPVLFPLTLRGMKESYPEILGGFDEALFYSDSYLPHKEEIEQMIDSKEYTTAAINARMVNLLRDRDNSSLTYKEVAVADILSDEMMDPSSELNMALMECLRMNDLTAGWTPSHPVRLYYSEADKVVPYENSIAVYDAFGAGKVKLEKGLSMDHGTACALWMLEVVSSALP